MSQFLPKSLVRSVIVRGAARFDSGGKSGLEAASALFRMILIDSIAREPSGTLRDLRLSPDSSDWNLIKSRWREFLSVRADQCLELSKAGISVIGVQSKRGQVAIGSIGNNFLTKLKEGDSPRPVPFFSVWKSGDAWLLSVKSDRYRAAIEGIISNTSPSFPLASLVLICAQQQLVGESSLDGIKGWISKNLSEELGSRLLKVIAEAEGADKELSAQLSLPLVGELADLDVDVWPSQDGEVEDELLEALEQELAVVLYGPPGSGKSHLAIAMAEQFAGSRERVSQWQFHPNTSYDDVVGGLVCTGPGLFQPRSGFFRQVCERAEADSDHRFCVVIDEVNRANVIAVFGEYLTLMERSRRGQYLQCRIGGEDFRISIPPNVGLVCTMNTADRTLDAIDVAMRRRMRFIQIDATRTGPYLRALVSSGMREQDATELVGLLGELNRRISGTPELGSGLAFGPWWFDCDSVVGADPSEWRNNFSKLLAQKVRPLLEERFANRPAEVERLLSGISGSSESTE